MSDITLFNETELKQNKKTMTSKELANVLGVTVRTINRHLKDVRLNLDNVVQVDQGNTSYITEAEAIEIKKRIETSGRNDLESVKNISGIKSKLEIVETFKKAALDLTALLQSENERLQKELAEAQPKVSYYDNLIDTGGLTNLRNTAKLLKIPERKFIKRLEVDGYLFRNKRGELQPYSEYNNLLFELKEWQHGEKSGVQTFVTVFGKKVFLDKYQKEQAQ